MRRLSNFEETLFHAGYMWFLRTATLSEKLRFHDISANEKLWLCGVLTPIASRMLPLLSNCLISPGRIGARALRNPIPQFYTVVQHGVVT